MSLNEAKVGVIGGGLGGLAAACTLAARGHSVVLLEKNGWLGGKAAVLEADGFRFDMGPTILTVPSILKKIFSEAGRRLQDYVDLVPLDPQWRCFYQDGSTLDLHSDVEAMKQHLESNGSASALQYPNFIATSQRLHEISERYFFWKPVGSVWDTLDFSTTFQPSVLKDLLAMRMGQSVSGTIRHLISDPKLAQMLDHFTQYIGSVPDSSPLYFALSLTCRHRRVSGIRRVARRRLLRR
ncbi:MAG: FAD-dependent oxidoreductase [Bryobacteraceae bacterium]